MAATLFVLAFGEVSPFITINDYIMMRTFVALSLSLSLSSAATAPATRPALKLRGGFAGVDVNTAATVHAPRLYRTRTRRITITHLVF